MCDKFDDVRVTKYNKESIKELKTPSIDVLKTLSFNEATKWSDDSLPRKVLEYGKKPPLGIDKLHELGITGKGVNVAIIDQPLALNHPEYKEKIVEYKTFFPKDYDIGISSMHGPAVTSLLVGENIGVAPDARVYYAAVPSWLQDAQYEVEALKWIMKVNEELEDSEKIKFVSVSAAPGNSEMRTKNSHLWNEVVKEAEKSGLCVVDCTEGHRFITAGYVEYETNDFYYGFPNRKMKAPQKGEVHVPNSLRTLAESYDNEIFSYVYSGVGGLSWGIPYAVGVLCLGQQINNELTALELKQKLIESASQNDCIISPNKFLKQTKMKLNKKGKR